MNTENQTIGKRIRSFREFQKLSREALAEKANISTQFLADIESGKKGMTVTTLKKICLALHVSSDSIVFGVENAKENPDINAMLSPLTENQKTEVKDVLQKIIRLIQP